MDDNIKDMLFDDSDLEDLFAELNESKSQKQQPEDSEMAASQRRYMDIIKKHSTNAEDEA